MKRISSLLVIHAESNAPGNAVEEHVNEPVGIVTVQGYAESKWVGEQILAAATRKAGLRTVAVRVGQLCGPENGYWNEHEWFPSLVKSAQHVGCLPTVDGVSQRSPLQHSYADVFAQNVTWLPLDAAALALIQMRHSDQAVLHLVHPRGAPWNSFVEPIARRLQVPLVPYHEWLGAMEQSLRDEQTSEVDTMRKNPALRILDFFRSVRFGENREPLGIVYLDNPKAQQVAPALGLDQLQPEFTDRWLTAWRQSGFIIAN